MDTSTQGGTIMTQSQSEPKFTDAIALAGADHCEIEERGGRVGLNREWQLISGSSAGCLLGLPIWGIM